MLLTIEEEVYGFKISTLQEADVMKVRCTICLLRNGAAVRTENIFLITLKGRDYLACKSCRDLYTGHRRVSDESTTKTDAV